jgi:cell division protein ZapD
MSGGSANRLSAVPDTRVICFEQPLNERVRTLLRLEFLFEQAHHHLEDDSVWGRRATLNAFLDVLAVLSRSDLKADVIKELTEQHTTLSRLEARAGVDSQRLKQVLEELGKVLGDMHDVSAQSANSLLHNTEFLSQLMNRLAIPGGTCGFDLPGYQHWLRQPETLQTADLRQWFASIEPFRRAGELILRLIRYSEKPSEQTAQGGVFMYNLSEPCQMLRVLIPTPSDFYPEISAGKQRFTIRFMEQKDGNERAVPTKQSVDFRLVCCSL